MSKGENGVAIIEINVNSCSDCKKKCEWRRKSFLEIIERELTTTNDIGNFIRFLIKRIEIRKECKQIIKQVIKKLAEKNSIKPKKILRGIDIFLS